MKILKGFLFAWLVGFSLATIAVAQDDQSGFISLDCGIPAGSSYTDITTTLSYTSDAGYVTGGVSNSISPIYQSNSLEKPFLTVTSFPVGTESCYTLNPAEGKFTNYLIRASFLYGDYDGNSQLPEFDLYLGEDYWDTVTIYNASIPTRKEIIYYPSNDYITVCLVKKDTTTPFISALELRPLNVTIYPTLSRSLQLFVRLNVGSLFNELIRYNYDAYDRIWAPFFPWEKMTTINTTQEVLENSYRIPSYVMSTAVTPELFTDSVSFYWTSTNTTEKYDIYFHFAELVDLPLTETREFNIYINDQLFYGPMSPKYLSTTTVYTVSPAYGYERYDVVINKTETSTLPPLLNAVEIYREI